MNPIMENSKQTGVCLHRPTVISTFQCKLCDFAADTQHAMDCHVLQQHGLRCSLCKFSSHSQSDLIKHVRLKHQCETEAEYLSSPNDDLDQDPCIACSFCDFKTYSTSCFIIHSSELHPEMAASSVAKLISRSLSYLVRQADALFYSALLKGISVANRPGRGQQADKANPVTDQNVDYNVRIKQENDSTQNEIETIVAGGTPVSNLALVISDVEMKCAEDYAIVNSVTICESETISTCSLIDHEPSGKESFDVDAKDTGNFEKDVMQADVEKNQSSKISDDIPKKDADEGRQSVQKQSIRKSDHLKRIHHQGHTQRDNGNEALKEIIADVTDTVKENRLNTKKGMSRKNESGNRHSNKTMLKLISKENLDLNTFQKSGERLFCPVCCAQYTRHFYFKKHLFHGHGGLGCFALLSKRTEQSNAEEEILYLCPKTCSYGTVKLDAFSKHVASCQKMVIIDSGEDIDFQSMQTLMKESGTETSDASTVTGVKGKCNSSALYTPPSPPNSLPGDRHLCEKTFQRRDNLRQHISEVHLKINPFTCPVCDRRFSRKSHLNKHLTVHNREPNLPQSSEDSLILQKRKGNSSSHPHSCPEGRPCCHDSEKTSCSRKSLRHHISEDHAKRKSHPCPVCDKQCSTKWNLEQHQLHIHNQRINVLPKDRHFCPLCEKKFQRRDNLRQHISEVHLKINPFTCPVCDRRFSRKLHVISHLTLHNRLVDKSPSSTASADSSTLLKRNYPHRPTVCDKNLKHAQHQSACSSIWGKGPLRDVLCESCGKVFKGEGDLELHIKYSSCWRSAGPVKRFHDKITANLLDENKCPICLEKVSDSLTLRTHLEKTHNDQTVFVSEILNKFFTDGEQPASSPPVEEILDNNCCPHCGMSFATNLLLETHLQHNEECKQAVDVTKTSSNRDQSRDGPEDALTNCLPKIVHMCHVCNLAFATSLFLDIHLKRRHGKEYKAMMCYVRKPHNSQTDTDNPKAELETGARLQGKVTCKVCNQSFPDNARLQTHMNSHFLEKPFGCKKCDMSFRIESNLLTHLKTHTKVSMKSSKTISNSNSHIPSRIQTKKKTFQCSSCPKTFSCSSNLNKHNRTHTGERPYKCKLCPCECIDSSNLKSHMKSHSDERHFQCDECGASFKYIQQFKPHLRTHTGELPFVCGECGKGFRSQPSLKIHATIHTGEKKFQCDICSKFFRLRSSRAGHMKVHQRICPGVAKSFSSRML